MVAMDTDNARRTNKVYKNSTLTLLTQVLQVFLGFFVRKVFIATLGLSYLGYNSVFLNILQMLNLADMGIGLAITSYLYKPLALGDNNRVSALMYIYKKIYQLIGIIVLGIGICISFFLNILIPDAQCSSIYLKIVFYINLAGTVSTYYLAYNRTLLIADQKTYYTSVIDTFTYFSCSIIQIIMLLTWPNYVAYLVVAIAKNIVSNIVITFKVKKKYVNLTSSVKKEYVEEYKPQIMSYIKDVFVSRIGAFVYYSTDNLIISVLKGSLLTGYLSNYTLITNQVANLVTQMLSSIQATFGNYIVLNDDNSKRKTMVKNYFCANFLLGNFCMICTICLIQPFIEQIFGGGFLLPFSTGLLLSVNLMLTILLQLPSQIFQIFKLFYYDKAIVTVSAALNIIISVVLVERLGINGCLIGTFITSFIYLFSRFYIVSSKVFQDKYSTYVFIILRYFMISVCTCGIVYYANIKIATGGMRYFLIRAILVGMEAILVSLLALMHDQELNYLINKMMPDKVKKIFSKSFIAFLALIFLVTSVLIGKWCDSKSNYNPMVGSKSIERTDKYKKNNINVFLSGRKMYHFSIDDVSDVFYDLSKNQDRYDTIFENDTLNWLKDLHDKYKVVTTCYVFYENENFSLAQSTNKYKQEFLDNSDWLRFAFHSKNGATAYSSGGGGQNLSEDYKKTMIALENIVGSDSIDNVIRMQSFQGEKKDIIEISLYQHEPLAGLLTADDMRRSYYLNDKDSRFIFSHDIMLKDNIYFVSTDLRVEFIRSVDKKIKEFESGAWNNQTEILEIFTHEWELNDENKCKIEKISQWALSKGYDSFFLEDAINDINKQQFIFGKEE